MKSKIVGAAFWSLIFIQSIQLVKNEITNLLNFAVETYPFQNDSLSFDERLDDLLDRLTLDEMIDQMAGGGGYPEDPAPSISRLSIPAFQFDTECLHGIMNMPATAFPQSIGLSASFSEETLFNVAEAIGTEARAYFNNASASGDYSDFHGANCFAPFNNVVHHPLWGRIQEVYGEDPFLSGKLASAYVKGMQGSHPKYVRAIAGCKVILVHSGPEDFPISRMLFDSKVNESDIRLTYLPSFKMCIEAGCLNLMCSYNSINGIPACANQKLITDIVRNEFRYNGFIVSDMDAIFNIYDGHKYANSTLMAAALAVNAGVDLELHGSQEHRTFPLLKEAVRMKFVNESTIKNRTRNLFYARMKLGQLNKPESSPYSNISLDVIQSEKHRKLALEVACKSFVLLRNDFNLLPLKDGYIDKLAIIGPFANNSIQIIGNYAPIIVPKFTTTPFDGIRKAASETVLLNACQDALCIEYNSSKTIATVVNADYVILCIGTGWLIENENRDRRTLNLPFNQQKLISDVSRYAKNPIVILIFSGGPVNLSPMQNIKAAIIQCFFPGETTGDALRLILFESYNQLVVSPAARLPYTWPMNDFQLPNITNYFTPNATYRYWTNNSPQYTFGYGLSYSKFLYKELYLTPDTVMENDTVILNVTIENIGAYDSDEVTQVYASWRHSSKLMPEMQLVAFKRTFVLKNNQKQITFAINSDLLKIWDPIEDGLVLKSGVIDIYVGGQLPFNKQKRISNILQAHIIVLN